jgi:hypothetical protein
MGLRTDGIRTVADLRDRCRVDDLTGCWRYVGAHADGHPSIYLPALRKRTTAGVAICVLLTGSAPAKGVYWHVTCETTGCCNPAHRQAGDRRSQMLAAKIVRDPSERARITAGRRKVAKLTAEQAAAIRTDDRVLREIAAEHGITISSASRIKRGELWRDPAASSVFAWRGATC